MRVLRKIILLPTVVFILLLTGCQTKENPVPSESTKKLMIVAHPDDETIFGGSHIADGGYYIVCLTNGKNVVRSKEFHKLLKATKNEGIILDFPDKTKGERDNWETSKEDIEKTISDYIRMKDWELIVTHNPKGEYGHIHHKMTNKIVTSVCEAEKQTNALYYFAPYYKKEKLPEYSLTPMDSESLAKKEKLVSIYSSQKKVCKNLSHIFPYESWTPYQ